MARTASAQGEEKTLIDEQRNFDILIVGNGPVGEIIANLLARRGHSVAIMERHVKPYRLPRAVHLVSETLRIVDAMGAAVEYPRFAVEGTGVAEFLDADQDVLLRFDTTAGCPQGWPHDLSLSQPDFEDVLREKAEEQNNIVTFLGANLVALEAGADDVGATYRDPAGKLHHLRGRYLIGCDGASSTVRDLSNFTMTDTGFSADWLVIDLRSEELRQWNAAVTQVCDPRRPTTCVESGPRNRRRFEFMRIGDETVAELSAESKAWALVEAWGYNRDNAVMEKKEVYTFRARWVDNWNQGRVFLAGDAAHQMPPMGGVGLVSGIRDAANLVWKLDLVLSGKAAPALLETYGSERSAHVQHAIWTSIEYGKIVCETDPVAAAARDQHFRAAGPQAFPSLPAERLGPGVFAPGALAASAWAGTLGPQGRVRLASLGEDLADRFNPGGFSLIFDGARVSEQDVAAAVAALPASIPHRIYRIVEPAANGSIETGFGAVDVEGVYRKRFDETGAILEVQRPDFYVYGLAFSLEEASGLIATLGQTLHLNPAAPSSEGRRFAGRAM